MLLAKVLNENVPQVYCEVYKHELADAIHMPSTAPRRSSSSATAARGTWPFRTSRSLTQLMDKGVGLGCIHYAVEVPKGEGGDDWPEMDRRILRNVLVGQPDLDRRLQPISPSIEVTPTASSRSRRTMSGITTCDSAPTCRASRRSSRAVPPDAAPAEGKDDAHGGNPAVRAGIGKNIPETTVWVATRDNDGRGLRLHRRALSFQLGAGRFPQDDPQCDRLDRPRRCAQRTACNPSRRPSMICWRISTTRRSRQTSARRSSKSRSTR